MRTPYFYKLSCTGHAYELHFHTGDGSELITHFDSADCAARAEQVANDAFTRGRLAELRQSKHRLNVETQQLRELLDSLSPPTDP